MDLEVLVLLLHIPFESKNKRKRKKREKKTLLFDSCTNNNAPMHALQKTH